MTPMGDARLVSVVMAVHNGELFLDEAIRSILDQRFGDFEFIIIDDGSTDGTGERLGHYRQLDGRVQVHTQEKQGHAASLNQGCGLARGKYLARMDADDIALPDRFERQVAFLERHPQVAVLGGAVQVINRAGRELCVDSCPVDSHRIRETLRHSSPFYHSSVMIRKAAFEAVQGYRPAFEDAEDYDLWLRMSEQYELANLKDLLICYRLSADQVSERTLQRQRTAHVAAEVAARVRRDTGSDPFWDVVRLTPDLLREHGITDGMLQRRLALAFLERAELMLCAGSEEKALSLLNQAFGHARSASAPRQLSGAIWTSFGRIHCRRGRKLHGFHCYARACYLDPARAAARLCRGSMRFLTRLRRLCSTDGQGTARR